MLSDFVDMIKRKQQVMIWAYVEDKLTGEEIDQVWVEILKYPKLLDYLKVVVGCYISTSIRNICQIEWWKSNVITVMSYHPGCAGELRIEELMYRLNGRKNTFMSNWGT